MKHADTGKTIQLNVPESRFDLRCAIYSLSIAIVLVAPLLYLDRRSDRDSFVTVSWLPGSLAADAAILGVLDLVLAVLVYRLLLLYPHFAFKNLDRSPLPRLRLELTVRSVLITAALIFAFWIPVMIVMYPCATNHDFINQVYQYQASAPTWYTTQGIAIDAEFIDHHPVFDTLVFGWFISVGDALESQNVGMFLFTLLQSFLTALCLGASVCYLERLDIPKCVRIGALAFAVFFPYYAPYACNAVKDMLYVLAFTPFCLLYLEAFRTKGEAMKRPGFLVALVLSMGFCILTKKLGIYVCLASMLVMILALRGVRMRALIVPVVSVLVFSLAFPAVVYPAIGGVAPGGKQESLCFALQQTTTLLVKDPDAISDEDMAVIERVLDTEAAVESYKPALADGAKNRFRTDSTDEDVRAYLEVWARQGLQNPKLYALSLAQCSGQMLIPSKQAVYWVTISDDDHLRRWGDTFNETSEGYHMELTRPAPLLAAAKAMRSFFLQGIGSVPVLNLVTTQGLYGGWIPFACAAITFINRKRDCLALAPVMWTVATLLISPGSLGRYVVCLQFLIIPVVGWMLHSFGNRKGNVAKAARGAHSKQFG
jgi:hypothetical protein